MPGSVAGRPLLTPVDEQAPERVRRLRGLGLLDTADPAFDVFAERLAEVTAVPWSMVNFIGEERQFLAGLHWPAGAGHQAGAADADRRSLARDQGYCPHVVVRRKALCLEDVRDYPRFAQNPVVDAFGVRSYLGAPLMDRTGMALGTVCVLDVAPRRWGRAGLETVKSLAAELTAEILRRDHGI